MRKKIEEAILHKAKQLVKRRRLQEELAVEYRLKFTKRTGLVAKLPKHIVKKPYHKQFLFERSRSHARSLSWGLWHAALKGVYRPISAILYRIEKPDSKKTRDIMKFGVSDSAIANVMNKNLLDRNLKRFSANSFAYRPDRNQFDAIINLKNYLKRDKAFVIQFDFKQYFDLISHQYIEKILSKNNNISISPLEKNIVYAFMKHNYAPPHKYAKGLFFKKTIGTPQGSSLSLFLANLANDALDKRLEGVNGQFVRYADDVVAVANTYEDAIKVEECFHAHCKESGLQINFEKSDGIRLLTEHQTAEITSLQSFKFVGYDFYPGGKCAISQKAIRKIKTKISKLINIYLIHYPSRFSFNRSRTLGNASLPTFDWDLIGLIGEIRGYLYGGCDEEQIRFLIAEGRRIPPMRGLMSFYALVDHREDLVMLDGWLVNNLRCALKKRQKILAGFGVAYPNFTNKSLIVGNWHDPAYNSVDFLPNPQLPSFVRGWRAARKYYMTFGLAGASPPPYSGY